MEEKDVKEIIAFAIDSCQRKGTGVTTEEVFAEYNKEATEIKNAAEAYVNAAPHDARVEKGSCEVPMWCYDAMVESFKAGAAWQGERCKI